MSSSVAFLIAGVGDLDCLLYGTGVVDGVENVSASISLTLRFFPTNSISLIWEYGTSQTLVGITQYALMSVTVLESLILTPTSIAHSNIAT